MRSITSILVVACLVTACGTTHVTVPVDPGALDAIAARAADDYDVERVDANTLILTNPWIGHSIATLGYSRFRADLVEVDGTLHGQFYMKNNSLLGNLFFNQRIDADEERFFGGALTGWIREEMDQVLAWSGADLSPGAVRDVRHGSFVTVDEMKTRAGLAPSP